MDYFKAFWLIGIGIIIGMLLSNIILTRTYDYRDGILDNDNIFKDKQVKPHQKSFREKVNYISETIWIHFPDSDSESYAELINEISKYLSYNGAINNNSLDWLIEQIHLIKSERNKEQNSL